MVSKMAVSSQPTISSQKLGGGGGLAPEAQKYPVSWILDFQATFLLGVWL